MRNRLSHIALIVILVMLSGITNAQHDACRDAVRCLARGDIEKTLYEVDRIHDHRNSTASVAEQWFVRTMVHCYQNELEEAFETAQKAVENGLPMERFYAGPREYLSPLFGHKPFKKWIKDNHSVLIHGPLLGSLTDTSTQFWVRTSKVAKFQVIVSENGSSNVILTQKVKSSPEADFTAIAKIEGLNPNTKYTYELLINNKKVGEKYEFITYPESNTPFKFQIAFGGGAGYTEKNERMWNTMSDYNPIATLLLGDNVYVDDPEHSASQRYCYYRRQSRPEFRNYTASNSIYAIYDDHDFGMNDCVPGPEIETPSWKRDVWNDFKNNWNNPQYGGGEKQPGCWFDYYIADVHFIMVDTRYYRDLEGENMLGDVQKDWLLKTLKSSTGKFKVLVSSVPWAPGVKLNSKDTWDGYDGQRNEIFEFIEENTIDGVVLMSADRHRSDMRYISRDNGYNLYEMMSSRLTNVHIHGLLEDAKGSHFIMGYNEDCSFGLVEFDTDKKDPEMNYKMINIDGEIVGEKTVQLSEISY